MRLWVSTIHLFVTQNKYMYTSHRERGNYLRRTRNRLSCCNFMTKSSTDIGTLGMRCNTALFVYMSKAVYIVWMTKSLNKEVKRTCILIDSEKTNMKYIKGCVKMVILSSTHIKADCDIWNHFISFFSLKVHVNIHKERGIFIKLSYCILKCKKL